MKDARTARRVAPCCRSTWPPGLVQNTSKQKERAMTQSHGNSAKDERELMQLVKELTEAVVKVDVAFLDRVPHEDYAHHRPRRTVENRAQYLENRKARRV